MTNSWILLLVAVALVCCKRVIYKIFFLRGRVITLGLKGKVSKGTVKHYELMEKVPVTWWLRLAIHVKRCKLLLLQDIFLPSFNVLSALFSVLQIRKARRQPMWIPFYGSTLSTFSYFFSFSKALMRLLDDYIIISEHTQQTVITASILLLSSQTTSKSYHLFTSWMEWGSADWKDRLAKEKQRKKASGFKIQRPPVFPSFLP